MHPSAILSPGIEAPVSEGPAALVAKFRCVPEKSPDGPVTLLISGGDKMVYVYRNGLEIGQSEYRDLGGEAKSIASSLRVDPPHSTFKGAAFRCCFKEQK